MNGPEQNLRDELRFDRFADGALLGGKKKGRLPAMGWNSWNAFGSSNSWELTKAQADRIKELGLDRLGYQYVVLDDGCYQSARKDGHLAAAEGKFPEDYAGIADYIHEKGLKFGMYNDIGTKVCSGAEVGICGHEDVDAADYHRWQIDYIKVDNCYYPWDDATFSDRENARYTYAPAIRGIRVSYPEGGRTLSAGGSEAETVGSGVEIRDGVAYGIGTYDGTGPEHSPVGCRSGELVFTVGVDFDTDAELFVDYATGREPARGSWLQVAVGEGAAVRYYYDGFLEETADPVEEAPVEGDPEQNKGVPRKVPVVFRESRPIRISLKAGENRIRLMNHRRQENTLCSYVKVREALAKAAPDRDIVFSLCEWGKTQPQNWGCRIGDSWRILNDITFQVGSDTKKGRAVWEDDYTASITSQYNKAVIMDEFAGLDKGWNDPDMMVIGLDGITETMARTHMAAWCMMNAPLMLGLDLREVQEGDAVFRIIANKELISLNQDPLGIQAKRVFTTAEADDPATAYIRDNHRIDVLAKPLADGSIALSFINLSMEDRQEKISISKDRILSSIGHKMKDQQARDAFENASSCRVVDLWTGDETTVSDGNFSVDKLAGCDNHTIRIIPQK
ncbi:MAG: glycoside hydrolase family 27 protein [Lachnospiraceae bacterium]|nr:glycoside hydrolase family 27 protein [Lachnospiraceae bacterium]